MASLKLPRPPPPFLATALFAMHCYYRFLSTTTSVPQTKQKLFKNSVITFDISISGPGNWSKHFPGGGGKRQSPIDIITSEARFDETLGDGQFQFNYQAADCATFCNTGFSWLIAVKDDAQSSKRE